MSFHSIFVVTGELVPIPPPGTRSIVGIVVVVVVVVVVGHICSFGNVVEMKI